MFNMKELSRLSGQSVMTQEHYVYSSAFISSWKKFLIIFCECFSHSYWVYRSLWYTLLMSAGIPGFAPGRCNSSPNAVQWECRYCHSTYFFLDLSSNSNLLLLNFFSSVYYIIELVYSFNKLVISAWMWLISTGVLWSLTWCIIWRL